VLEGGSEACRNVLTAVGHQRGGTHVTLVPRGVGSRWRRSCAGRGRSRRWRRGGGRTRSGLARRHLGDSGFGRHRGRQAALCRYIDRGVRRQRATRRCHGRHGSGGGGICRGHGRGGTAAQRGTHLGLDITSGTMQQINNNQLDKTTTMHKMKRAGEYYITSRSLTF